MNLPVGDFFKLSWMRKLLVIATYLVFWVLLDFFAAQSTITSKPSSWYPNTGIAVGFTVYFGWPMIFMEMICRAILAGPIWGNELDLARSFIFVVVPGFFNWQISTRVRQLIVFEGRVDSAKMALLFLAFAFINAIFRSTTVHFFSVLFGIGTIEEILPNFFMWVAGDLIGFITLSPFVIAVLGPLLAGGALPPFDQKKIPFILTALLSLTLLFVLLTVYQPHAHYAYWHLAIGLHVFTAWSLGFRWTALQILIVNFLLSFVEAAFPSEVLPLEQQSFLALTAGAGLFLAAMFGEKFRHREIMEHLSADLQNAGEEKSEFRNVLSHELRTPLAVILGYSELMKKSPSLFSSSQALDKIKTNTHALSEILSRLMILTNPQGAWKKSRLERIDLREVLSKVTDKWTGLAQKKNVELRWIAGETPEMKITVIPEGVRIVLDEIIGNAVKFTDSGFVKVTASMAERGKTARITVEDSGAGIDPSFPLFRTFEQQTGGLTRPQGGLGIGLSICRMLLETMGGKIILKRSEPGRGSLFEMEFYDQAVR